MRLKYRTRTKVPHTLKIIHNIICTYLEYQNYIRRYRNSQSFVSNDSCFSYCVLLPLDSTSCENGYPTAKKLVCSVSGGGRMPLKATQIEFCTQFGMEPHGFLFLYTKRETLEWKACVWKGKRPGWPFVSDAAVLRVRSCFHGSLPDSPWLYMKIVS